MFGTSSYAQVPYAALPAAGTSHALSITENFTAADSRTQIAAFLQSLTENTSIADVLTNTAGFFASATENIGSADTNSITAGFSVSASENVNPADVLSITAAFANSISEATTLGDSSIQQSAFLQSRTENISLADSSTQQSAFLQSLTENSSLADTPTVSAQFSQSLTENSNLTDVLAIGLAFSAAVTEATTLDDTRSATAQFPQSVTENTSIADSSTQQSAFLQSISENSTVADAQTVTAQFLQSLSEGFSVADVPTIAAQFAQAISEGLTAAESAVIANAFLLSITENFSAADTQTAGLQFLVSVVENLSVADTPTAFSAFSLAIAENISLLDANTVSGWIKVIDEQNANWAVINDAQANTWANVDASQATGWNIIPITTDRYGPTWAASAAGGGTAILLNGQQTTDGYQQYMLYRNGAWIVPRLTIPGVFNSIQYINSQYFVYSANTSVSYGAKLLRSTDGLNWSAVTTLPTSTPDTRQVVGMFGNGSTIVIAYNNLTYISTDNCATWTASSALPGDLQGAVVGFAFGAGLYVMCDGRRVFTSANALTWTQAVSFTGVGWSGQRGSVSWSGSRFVVIARSTSPSASPQIRTSTNGITWTTVSPPSPLSTQAVWAFWDGLQFVFATAGAGSTNAAFYAANSTLTTFTLLGYLPGRFYIPTVQASYLMGSINGQYIPPGFASPATGTFYTSPNFSTFNAINAAWPTNAWGVLDASTATSWNNIPSSG